MSLVFQAKQLVRDSTKAEAECKKEKLKIKAAMEKGNADMAKIHAQNWYRLVLFGVLGEFLQLSLPVFDFCSIRHKSQATNYLKLSSRMDAVAQRISAAKKMQDMGVAMGSIVKSMGITIESMNVEQLSNVMDQFEKQFETLDIQAGVMDKAIESSTATATTEDEVNELMSMVCASITAG